MGIVNDVCFPNFLKQKKIKELFCNNVKKTVSYTTLQILHIHVKTSSYVLCFPLPKFEIIYTFNKLLFLDVEQFLV